MGKLLIVIAFLLSGCELDEYSQAYIAFLDTHGSEDRYYCDEDTGFFMHEHIESKEDYSALAPIFNDAGDPVECNRECQT